MCLGTGTYLERGLERLDALHGGAQALLQLGQLAAQVGVVPHQLLVHFRELLQVVLQERDLLFLGERTAFFLGAFFRVGRFLNSRLVSEIIKFIIGKRVTTSETEYFFV